MTSTAVTIVTIMAAIVCQAAISSPLSGNMEVRMPSKDSDKAKKDGSLAYQFGKQVIKLSKIIDKSPANIAHLHEPCHRHTHDVINHVRQIHTTCSSLQDKLLLPEVVFKYPDMTPFWTVTSRLMTLTSVFSQFSLDTQNCTLMPQSLRRTLSDDVIKGTQLGLPLVEDLKALHAMWVGGSRWLSGGSVAVLYEKRLPLHLQQSRKWYTEGLQEYVTLLQAAGLVLLQTSGNSVGEHLSQLWPRQSRHGGAENIDKDDNRGLEIFMTNVKKQRRVNKKVKDFYTNGDNEPLFSLQVSRNDAGVLQKLAIDTRVVGCMPGDDCGDFTHIQGCQLMENNGKLSLGCQAKTWNAESCKGGGDDLQAAFISQFPRDVGMREFVTPRSTEQFANTVEVDVNNKSVKLSVSQDWARTMKPHLAVCAVKLHVTDDVTPPGDDVTRSSCLGLAMYFCNPDPCDRKLLDPRRRKMEDNWKYTCVTSQKKKIPKRKKKKQTSTEWWKDGGCKVDGHMTSPRHDGRTAGMRLYAKYKTHLAIGLRTEFD